MSTTIYGLPGLNGSNGGLHVSETPAEVAELLDDRGTDYIVVHRNSDAQEMYAQRDSIAFFVDASWTFGSG